MDAQIRLLHLSKLHQPIEHVASETRTQSERQPHLWHPLPHGRGGQGQPRRFPQTHTLAHIGRQPPAGVDIVGIHHDERGVLYLYSPLLDRSDQIVLTV